MRRSGNGGRNRVTEMKGRTEREGGRGGEGRKEEMTQRGNSG